MTDQSIADLVATQPQGMSLQQGFYRDPAVLDVEMQRIFLKSWLYVGHVSEIPDVGDYLLFEITNESVIIVRSAAETIHALVNVCRHRGSRVCTKPSGHEQLFVCGYHGWTYQLDGILRGARHLDSALDKSRYSLKQIHVEVLQGLIFVNFDADPVSFSPIKEDLNECLRPYGLDQAKVAKRASYPIDANWKLALENYCECYHCAPAHPEYTQGHGRAVLWSDVEDLHKQVMNRAAEVGLTTDNVDRSWANAGAVGIDRGFDRYPLFDGFVTGSRDGAPVAPLLGDLTGYDHGATDIHIGPPTFFLAYCDHVVVYRFTPLAVDSCDCEITWLVNGDAEEGKDYQLDELTWLWDVTTLADKTIIENNQKGVNSRFYEPGPYTKMEDFTRSFVQWYLSVMSSHEPAL